MPCVVPTINLFSIQEIGHPKWRVALGFRAGLFEGFFRTPCGHSAAAVRRHIQSLRPIRLIFTAPIDFSARRCERIRTLNRLRAEGLATFPLASCRRDRWSGVLRINRRTAGGLRSSRADRGAQVLPPAGATVPPSIPLLRRRPRTGLDQAGSTPELRRPIARRAPAAGQSEQDA